mmetsp:Transcript_28636/g.43245  ORF Transcript_28636/g.43245 Transcript_28636/m.43245 type:complete len:131 (+) Transcript_28636:3415-3807(+)
MSVEKQTPAVLVVDDEEMNRMIITTLLENTLGVKSEAVVSGEEAILHFKKRIEAHEELYKLIVMDINMPVLDGKETTKALRKMIASMKVEPKPEVRIIAHTAMPASQLGNFKQEGFDDFVHKTSTLKGLK